MKINPAYSIDKGYKLLHQGTLALAIMEGNGIRIDVPLLRQSILETEAKAADLLKEMRASEMGRQWQKRLGPKTNIGSNEQLGKMLFSKKEHGGLGLKPSAYTKTGKPATDDESLQKIKLPFVEKWSEYKSLLKTCSTFLKGILNEVDSNGILHPVFSLNTTVSYRSSSENPNFQNFPVRDIEMGELVRKHFIAREGCVLIENDFKGVEVSVAACYHKDPVMLEYIQDETKDMHRDMAMQIYILNAKQWARLDKKMAKAVRHAAKNMFVFPEFYGDWYMSCAIMLWEEMDKRGFKGPNGEPMQEWLRAHGISELGDTEKDEEGNYPDPVEGTFIYHLKEIENDFWNNRFKVYGKWKKKWYERYRERGYFKSYTGFTYRGVMAKNQVINYAVQGSAFHCLLWSLIRIQKEIRKLGMKTKIVGQIHDSILADVPIEEVDQYLAIVKRVTMTDIRKDYTWLNLPLVIECEISPIGKSWFHKREVKMNADGSFSNSEKTFTGTARNLLKFWQKN